MIFNMMWHIYYLNNSTQVYLKTFIVKIIGVEIVMNRNRFIGIGFESNSAKILRYPPLELTL